MKYKAEPSKFFTSINQLILIFFQFEGIKRNCIIEILRQWGPYEPFIILNNLNNYDGFPHEYYHERMLNRISTCFTIIINH